jgi:hypothetical protein
MIRFTHQKIRALYKINGDSLSPLFESVTGNLKYGL